MARPKTDKLASLRNILFVQLNILKKIKKKSFVGIRLCNSLKLKLNQLVAFVLRGSVTTLFSATQRLTLLRHCFEWLQHCPSIATLGCAKNRRCESSRVTSA